jgi:hypothetical protein
VNSPERAAQIKACFDKKKAGRLKKSMKAPTTTTRPKSQEGTGGPNDPAWKGLADLAKNGLPG